MGRGGGAGKFSRRTEKLSSRITPQIRLVKSEWKTVLDEILLSTVLRHLLYIFYVLDENKTLPGRAKMHGIWTATFDMLL